MSLLVGLLVAAGVWCWPPVTASAAFGRVSPEPSAPEPPGSRPLHGGGGVVGRRPRPQVAVVELSSVAELLALALRSGVGISEAMDSVAEMLGGVLGRHLRSVSAAHRWGLSEREVWSRLPAAWDPIARALRLSQRAGIAPVPMLLAAAEDLRRAEDQRLRLATATLGVRVALPLGLAFLPAFVLTTVVPVVLALASNVLRN